MIRLFPKTPEEFVRLILQGRFWVVHIPFLRRIELQFVAQIPLDYLAYTVMSNLIVFLFNFAAFDYYVIDRFVSITT